VGSQQLALWVITTAATRTFRASFRAQSACPLTGRQQHRGDRVEAAVNLQ
jgi:hypothetical protein